MVIGILCILGGLLFLIIGSLADRADTTPPPQFDSDKEFWDYQVKLSGIIDPHERRAYERKVKRELQERQRNKEKTSH